LAWVKNNASATSGQSQQIYAGTTEVQTLSVYLKAGATNWIRLNLSGGGNYFFDIQNGVVGSSGTAGLMPKITAAGNGYYRCSITNTTGNSASSINVFAGASDGVLSTSAGDTFYIQAVQREAGDIATDYIPTTTVAVSVGPVANLPRLNYPINSVGCPSLLLEPQRTNLVTYSENFDNAAWTKANCTVTANQTESPSGYVDADLVTTTNTSHALFNAATVTASTAYTFSFYVKRGTMTDLAYRVFNLAAGGDIVAPTSYYSQTTASGWSRITLSFTTPAGCTSVRVYPLANSGAIGTAYLWGAQMEAGAYATSYIPTLGAAVTRLAEQYDKVITSLVPDATTFTWEVDFIVPEVAAGGGEIFGRNAAGTIQLRLYANNGGAIRFRVESGGQNYDTAVSVGDTAKCIFRCSSGVVSAFYNGVKIHTFTGVSMDFGKIQFFPNATSPKIIRSLVFPTALTDAQCIELTTL
jgi:hypothetical protein